MKKFIIGALLGITPVSVIAEESFFTGEFLLGKTTQEVEGDDGSETSIGVRGSYNISQYLGFELSYQDYGEATWDYIDGFGDRIDEATDTSSLNLAIKGSLPFESGLSLHLRAGLSFWDLDVEVTASSLPGNVYKVSDSGNDFFYGIGAQYLINDKFIVGLEYTVAEYEAEPDGDLEGIKADLEIDTLALTVGIKF